MISLTKSYFTSRIFISKYNPQILQGINQLTSLLQEKNKQQEMRLTNYW